jgi:hypothetical protein
VIEGDADEGATLWARPPSEPVAKSLKGSVEMGEDRLEHAVICPSSARLVNRCEGSRERNDDRLNFQGGWLK